MAAFPQAPTQGSTHLFRTHARSRGHSELTTHSGRHPPEAASPLVPDGHEHIAVVPVTVHNAPGPHGDGVHGGAVRNNNKQLIYPHKYLNDNPSTILNRYIKDVLSNYLKG